MRHVYHEGPHPGMSTCMEDGIMSTALEDVEEKEM